MSSLRQKPVASKTATATLTYKEFGDVVVDSSGAATITLPAPSSGLWYRISSVNSGEVSVSDGSNTLATLKQAESALFLANSTSGCTRSTGSRDGYRQTNAYGMKIGLTYETCESVRANTEGVAHDTTTMTMAYEAFVNFILQASNEAIKH